MTLPQHARMILGALGMVLLLGLLGLAWWWWHHRPGYQPAARLHRVRVALGVAGLVIIAVGSAVRLVTVFHPPPSCSPPGGAQPTRSGRFDASLLAQETATWPETGVLYSWAKDARVCLSRSAYYYVAVHANTPAGADAMTMGDIVLTPGFDRSTPGFDRSRAQLQKLIGHEARHRVQWAIGTAIGGPFAFPVAYAIDDFFFPGSRNYFERQAGLESGSYRHSGNGPVLGPAQVATLVATLGILAAIIVVALLVVWHRHTSMRARSRANTAGADIDHE